MGSSQLCCMANYLVAYPKLGRSEQQSVSGLDYLCEKRNGHVLVVSSRIFYSPAHDLDLLRHIALGAIFSKGLRFAADTYQPFMMPKFLSDSFKPDPVTFPHNRMFVVVFVGWSLFCMSPLWMMLGNCSNQNPFPPAQQNSLPQPDLSTPGTQSNVVLDHGPGRVACDLQWSRSSEKSADGYPDFLRKCMNK